MPIHPTAIVESGAVIADTAIIGPWCHIGANVKISDGVELKSHIVIEGDTEIGAGTRVYPYAYLGGPPQHVGYKGEPTKLVVGARNVIRENSTFNLGTVPGGGVTRVGDDGFFMTGAHIGHDSQVGDRVIFANNATLGGHSRIGDGVFLGGLTAVHQNSRVGAFAFIGGCAAVTSDVIPYASAMGNHARLYGLNVIGLKRRGLSRTTIRQMRSVYRLLFADEGTFRERLEQAREEYGDVPEAVQIIEFAGEKAVRPLMTPAR